MSKKRAIFFKLAASEAEREPRLLACLDDGIAEREARPGYG